MDAMFASASGSLRSATCWDLAGTLRSCKRVNTVGKAAANNHDWDSAIALLSGDGNELPVTTSVTAFASLTWPLAAAVNWIVSALVAEVPLEAAAASWASIVR